jgi:hypothetical protein
MPIQYVNTGSSPNKGDGDSLRLAFNKINNNFTIVESLLGTTATDITQVAQVETRRLLVHNDHSGITVGYDNQTDRINLTTLNLFDQDLRTTDTPTFDNLNITNTATFGGDIDVGGTIKVGLVQGFDDFSIIKEDPNGLYFRLRNMVNYGASAIELLDNYYGGLVILHQNQLQSGDYLPDNNYIYSQLPSGTLNIGRYSDINFYADSAAYNNYGAILNSTASIRISSDTGNVTINKPLTVASTTATGLIYLGTSNQYRSKIERSYAPQVGSIFSFAGDYNGNTPALTGGDYLYLPVTSESSSIQAGWILTFANGHQEVLEDSELIDFGNDLIVWSVRWLAGLDYPANQVWPVVINSPDYLEVVRTVDVVPDVSLPTVKWSFERTGLLKFPDGTEQRTAYIGAEPNSTSTFYSVQITSTASTTLPTTGALTVAGGVGVGENLHVAGVGYFGLEPSITLSNPLAIFTGDADNFTQIAIQNLSTGTGASSDIVATANDGTDELYYIDFGINNSNYSDLAWTMSGPHDGYVYVSNGILTLGTTEPGTTVKIHIGGTTEENVVAIFRDPTTDSTSSFTGALTVNGGMGITGQVHLQETLHVGANYLSDLLNPVFVGTSDVNGYTQVAIQNRNSGPLGSSDFVATADNGSDASHYIDMGIASSTYNYPGFEGITPNDGYLLVSDGNLVLSSIGQTKKVKILVGGALPENLVATFDLAGTDSTSTTTGALTVAGGIGVAGDIVSHNLIPAADLTYDLGSTSSQWRSLYVGTSTIYLGGTALSVSGGNLTIDGSPVQGGGAGAALGDRLTSSTYEVILEGTTGTFSVPNVIISQGYELGLAGSQYSYEVNRYLRVRDGDVASHIHFDSPDNSQYDLIFGDDAKFVRVDHTGTVVIGTTGYNWSFGLDGSLTLPSIVLAEGLTEQAMVKSQRKIIPSNHWSAVINGSTATVVYTAATGTVTVKGTITVQHDGLGLEMFDVSALAAGASTLYSVSNRLNGTAQPDTTVIVDYNGSNQIQITLTVNSGATTAWVTYDTTEFGMPNDQ